MSTYNDVRMARVKRENRVWS